MERVGSNQVLPTAKFGSPRRGLPDFLPFRAAKEQNEPGRFAKDARLIAQRCEAATLRSLTILRAFRDR
jgi:hypothetical protein